MDKKNNYKKTNCPAGTKVTCGAGFTLIEVLIAIAILGTALIAAIEMFSSAERGADKTQNLAIATNLAQEKLEQVKNLVREGIVVNVGSGSNLADGFLPALTDVSTDSYLGGNIFLTESNSYPSTDSSLTKMDPLRRVDRITQVTWAEGINTYKKVQVTVFWQEKGNTASCGLVTLIRE